MSVVRENKDYSSFLRPLSENELILINFSNIVAVLNYRTSR